MSSQTIEYFRFDRNESCTEEGCRAQKFYIEDGRKFCRVGHEQAGFTQTQQDEDDFNSQGTTSRKRGPIQEHVPATLSGLAAKELYMQCLQLILCKQCHWLITIKGFSAEVQTIVRDLWALRVGKVWHEKSGKFSSQSGTDQALFSSQSEVDTMGHPRDKALRKRKKNNETLPKLIETLSLCYLGMLLMRLPISIGEVLGWVTRNEILYLKALKAIPKYMRSKLPASFHIALELKVPLSGPALYGKIQDLVVFFNKHYHMTFPPLNTPLLTYKHILTLGLPIEIYPAIERLKDILGLEFKFSIPRLSSIGHRVSYPEIQLICLIVIATKLIQPHDDIKRDPESELDPTIIKINWEKWGKTMVNRTPERFERGAEINLKEKDVWNLNDGKIDQYLDWFQEIMLDDRDPKGCRILKALNLRSADILPVSQNILELFPLQNVNNQRSNESDLEMRTSRLKTIHDDLLLQEVLLPENDNSVRVRRPGELYKRYRKIGELNLHAKTFYTLAASTVGIPLKMLLGVVFQLEIKLDKWAAAEREKGEYAEKKTKLKR